MRGFFFPSPPTASFFPSRGGGGGGGDYGVTSEYLKGRHDPSCTKGKFLELNPWGVISALGRQERVVARVKN